MSYSEIFAHLRKKSGYSQFYVAEYISKHSLKPCSNKRISHWETGASMPSIDQFLLLCELYGVRDIQGAFRGLEHEFHGLAKLNALGKSRAEEYISLLSSNPLFATYEHESLAPGPGRFIRLYDIPAAAGTGSFLGSDGYEDFEVDETVPANADFAVKVSGDSMTPRFVDRQIAFVKEQHTLEIGDIGIVALDGEAYIKKLGHGELLSLNPRYKPISIRDSDAFHIFGKVVR